MSLLSLPTSKEHACCSQHVTPCHAWQQTCCLSKQDATASCCVTTLHHVQDIGKDKHVMVQLGSMVSSSVSSARNHKKPKTLKTQVPRYALASGYGVAVPICCMLPHPLPLPLPLWPLLTGRGNRSIGERTDTQAAGQAGQHSTRHRQSPGSVSCTIALRSRTGGWGYSRMLSFTQRITYLSSV